MATVIKCPTVNNFLTIHLKLQSMSMHLLLQSSTTAMQLMEQKDLQTSLLSKYVLRCHSENQDFRPYQSSGVDIKCYLMQGTDEHQWSCHNLSHSKQHAHFGVTPSTKETTYQNHYPKAEVIITAKLFWIKRL